MALERRGVSLGCRRVSRSRRSRAINRRDGAPDRLVVLFVCLRGVFVRLRPTNDRLGGAKNRRSAAPNRISWPCDRRERRSFLCEGRSFTSELRRIVSALVFVCLIGAPDRLELLPLRPEVPLEPLTLAISRRTSAMNWSFRMS